MELGLIGLGKMGGNMARRWIRGGHTVVGYARTATTVQAFEKDGMVGASSVENLVKRLPPPRAVWLMLPAGKPTDDAVSTLSEILSRDDVIVDGGNTYYKDDLRRAGLLEKSGIHYVDQGTSGGVWGLKEGYSLMIGGDEAVVDRLKPAFVTLAPGPDRGWGRVGPVGAGHFVKMVHNGIEYGMMQSFAEGYNLMQAADEFSLDLHRISRIWQHGSVVRSWLLDLTANALQENPRLEGIEAWVADSGEGRWTVQEGIERSVPVPVIAHSLMARFRSRQSSSFADRLLAALRNQFGGHAIKKSDQ
ncbi:MAG: decarboxylating 6-phosphogluconate dehydrogenase [Acidobacteria bacterium]|nr:decarboxylating 6-phosphogluconate dehydrogenase [Acidobacteriota bacterium]